MSLAKVKALMKKVGTGFLATTDGRRPAVRPMSAYAWYGKELWLATSIHSGKVGDIRKRPAAELCLMDPKTYTNVRIAGRCRISIAAADKKKLFGAFPWMKDFFQAADSPGWAVLRIKLTRIRIMTMQDLKYRDVKI